MDRSSLESVYLFYQILNTNTMKYRIITNAPADRSYSKTEILASFVLKEEQNEFTSRSWKEKPVSVAQ